MLNVKLRNSWAIIFTTNKHYNFFSKIQNSIRSFLFLKVKLTLKFFNIDFKKSILKAISEVKA